MRKILKIIAILLSLPVLAFLAYYIYLVLPSFLPTYPVDSCVIDTQVQRIHKITGYDDRLKGSGVPTIILVTGMATPGNHEVGSKGNISLDHPHIKQVDCPALKLEADTCWNYVIEHPQGSYHWQDDCKGDFQPFEEMMCGNKEGPSLNEDEIKMFKTWVKSGSPKTSCEKYVPKDLCFEKVFKDSLWPDGCKGNPDPHLRRCTAAYVPLTLGEKTKYEAWVKANKPQTPCQKRALIQ